MIDLFFYGTLRYLPVLECVLGRSTSQLNTTVAYLDDHEVRDAAGHHFPTICHAPGARTEGLLVRDLDADDLESLAHYEAGFSCDIDACQVTTSDGVVCEAQIFSPETDTWATGDIWDFESWQKTWGALSLRSTEEVMAWKGRRTPEQMAASLHSIRNRASAWVALQQEEEHPDHPLERDVVVHAHKREYVNYFAMDEMDLQFRRFDGTMSEVINRGAFLVGRASAVLPYDPWRDEILLIQQFRASVFIAGDKQPWLWEAVAGVIDPGESPEEAAIREAEEEAGIVIKQLEPVARTFPSSGSMGEIVHHFVGVGSFEQVAAGGGLASEGEDIRHRVLSFDSFMEGIDAGKYRDGPLVTCALWLSRHRDRLRGVLK